MSSELNGWYRGGWMVFKGMYASAKESLDKQVKGINASLSAEISYCGMTLSGLLAVKPYPSVSVLNWIMQFDVSGIGLRTCTGSGLLYLKNESGSMHSKYAFNLGVFMFNGVDEVKHIYLITAGSEGYRYTAVLSGYGFKYYCNSRMVKPVLVYSEMTNPFYDSEEGLIMYAGYRVVLDFTGLCDSGSIVDVFVSIDGYDSYYASLMLDEYSRTVLDFSIA